MSIRVDFYLSATPAAQRLRTACRITDKAFRQGHQIYLHTESPEQASELDSLLWTFHDLSFVPHCLATLEETADIKVQIGYDRPPKQLSDILINLCRKIPDFYSDFRRIIEIIPQEEEWREGGRERFKYYRDQGCQLQTHHI